MRRKDDGVEVEEETVVEERYQVDWENEGPVLKQAEYNSIAGEEESLTMMDDIDDQSEDDEEEEAEDDCCCYNSY